MLNRLCSQESGLLDELGDDYRNCRHGARWLRLQAIHKFSLILQPRLREVMGSRESRTVISPKKSNNLAGAGCMALFGLPFAAIATFFAYELLSMVWLGYQAQSWETVPAKVISAKLDEHRSDGNSTYKVVASYRYNYQGDTYDSDKVALYEERDSFKSYHNELFKRLKKAKKKKKPIDCYVNPSNPSESLLDRTIRLTMILMMSPFVLAFGLVGYGLMIGAVYSLRAGKKKKQLIDQDPDKPWLWREDWKQGVVKSGTKYGLYAIGGFALLWNAISFPIAAVLFLDEDENPWWARLIVLIFPLIGVALIGYCVYLWLRIQKYGKSIFRMGNVPGVIGGRLSGVVIVPKALTNAKSIRTKLVCTETVGRGDDQTDEVRWQDDRTIKQTLASDEPGKVGIPIIFAIPSDAPPTNEEQDFKWTLSVKAKTPGVDFGEVFEVPVFWTEDSQEDFQIDDEPLSDYEEIIPLEQQLAEQGIIVEHLTATDSIRYSLPPGKNKTMSVVVTIAMLMFSGASIGMLMSQIWLMGGIFSLFALLLIYSTFECWLGCSDLTIVGERWTSRSGWFGFRGKGQEFTISQIKSIIAQDSMSSGSGSEQKQWRNLKVKLIDDKELMLVMNVLAGSTERNLLADLRRRAGMDPTVTDEEVGLWDFVEKEDFDDLSKEGNI